MKKQITIVLSMLMTLCISSCSTPGSGSTSSLHEHTFDTHTFFYDDNYHWNPSTCGHDVQGSKTKHNMKEEVYAPTYDSNGYTYHYCTTCNFSYKDNETPKLVHHYSDEWSYNEQSHFHKCTDEGYESFIKDSATHDFEISTVEPTFTEKGYTIKTCKVCGYFEKYMEKDPKKHKYSSSWAYDENKHWHACIDEGYEDTFIDDDSHDFEEYVKEATYDEAGYTEYTCKVCGYSYRDDEQPQLVHKYSDEWSHDNDYHWHACIDKGHTDLYIDKALHDYQEEVIEPTKALEGYTRSTCKECGYYYDHDYTSALGYTITWKDYDGTVLDVNEHVQSGDTPSCFWGDPYRSSTAEYNYSFSGWSPKVVPATKDTEYIATYERTDRKYTVTFNAGEGYFGDDKSCQTKTVEYTYGTTPDFDEVPTGVSRNYKTITFAGWDKTLSPVTDNVTYYAQYNYENAIDYDVCLTYKHSKGRSSNVGFTLSNGYSYSGSVIWGDGTTTSISSSSVSHAYNQAFPSGDLFIYITFNSNCRINVNSDSFKANNYITRIDVKQKSYVNSNTKDEGLLVSHKDYYFTNLNGLETVKFGEFYKYSNHSEGSQTILKTGESKLKIANNPNLTKVSFDKYTYSCWSKYEESARKNTGIDNEQFYNNPKLETIDFGSECTVSKIGDYAFQGCTKLSNIRGFNPGGQSSIGTYAFRDCVSLSTSIYFSGSLTSISSGIFYGCSSIYSINLPSSITSISGYAFGNCTKLHTIYYGSSISKFYTISIASTAFKGCSGITVKCSDGEISL